jgi:acyl-CoA synthetase (NDP forming)
VSAEPAPALGDDAEGGRKQMKEKGSLELIRARLARGERSLSEHDSARILEQFGVPIGRQILAADPKSASQMGARLGFPVALKASGAALVHKSEMGGVVLGLRSKAEVEAAAERLLTIEGCDAVLVQEMVVGDREFVCGMVRDRQFGPCVMFGVGGTLTEALGDAVFAVAPLSDPDAAEMIQGIRSLKLLGPFRGQAAVDTAAVVRVLVALGEIAVRHPEVAQIDVNPLKIRSDGTPVAVDTLVVLDERRPDEPCAASGEDTGRSAVRVTANDRIGLAPLFEPASVAVVGASGVAGKPGNEVIRNIQANGYAGRLYPVNPKGGEILGLPTYQSLAGLPETPDLAIIIVPAEQCPRVLQECADKGVKHAVILAGGFAEVDEAGAGVQEQLVRIARQNGIQVVGPNTGGHISTPNCFTSAFFPLGRVRPGRVSYVAQTGNFCTHTMRYILTAEHFGVARVVGLGNAIDVDESEMLEYLASDDATEAVVMYLESFKRPRRFLELAREVTRVKPVVLLKSGSSEAGRHAAVAHTAALAAEDRIVDGMLRQAGVVRIWDYTHLILAGKGLSMTRLPRGNRISMLAPSGAMLVVLSDLASRLGLEVPEVGEATLRRLQELSPPYIRMRNPVDIWAATLARGVEAGYREGMRAVLDDPSIDAVVPILLLTEETGMPSTDFIVELAQEYPDKPILAAFTGDKRRIDQYREDLEARGVATFLEIEQPLEVLAILSKCRGAMGRPR